MAEPIEDLYFNWLCAKVLPVGVKTYHDLLRILHSTEFVWTIPGDKNRVEDGLELRLDFLRETNMEIETEWYQEPVSVLELFLALANRANFQTESPVRDWFWKLISNLELDDFRRVSRSDERHIHDVLHDFIWRNYNENGYGGIFPMRWPQQDQREVEIWYQLCQYLDEQGLV